MVVFAHCAGGAEEGNYGQDAAEGDEGFLAEAAGYYLEAGLGVEVSGGGGVSLSGVGGRLWD